MNRSQEAMVFIRGLKTIEEIRAFYAGYEMGGGLREVSEALEAPVVQAKPQEIRPQRLNRNRGAQASVYRMLSTGPASLDALCRALPSYTRDTIRQALTRMLNGEEVSMALDRPGGIEVATLTPTGKIRAAWFVAHPDAKLYGGLPI